MSNIEPYLLPAGFGEAEFTEKRSRFIGRVWPIGSEEEALEHIRQMREKHWDATHNVYAYAVKANSIMRFSDDGEPQGSSGMPTLNVFRSAGISDFCCVVTRYFGGILLGTGGLVRAYSQAASMALNAAGISEMRLWGRMLVDCPYSLYERIVKEADSCGAAVCSTDYGASVTIELLLQKEECDAFSLRLRDISSGTVQALLLGEEFAAAPKK